MISRHANPTEVFRTFPWSCVTQSATIDMAVWCATARRAVRVHVTAPSHIVAWATEHGIACATDEHGYAVLARTRDLANQVLSIDQSALPHEEALGALLGYPACCRQRISAIGEAKIDVAATEASTWSYAGRFWMIDPTGYHDGHALISHIPCCAACGPSLGIARRTRCFVVAHSDELWLSPLADWIMRKRLPPTSCGGGDVGAADRV